MFMQVCVHTHTNSYIYAFTCVISQIQRTVTGSCAKIANRMLPYSSPLFLTFITHIPSFPFIVQQGTSGILNMFIDVHTAVYWGLGDLHALEVWIMFKH